MRIVYISKYLILPEYGPPTRHYFLSKGMSRLENSQVMLIGSRSSLGRVPGFNGLFLTRNEGDVEMVTLNGPDVTPGFNKKRLWSWVIFEKNLYRFREYIKRFRPEVIVVSSLSILTFLTGVFLKKWLKVPLVLEVRDIYPLTLVEVGNYKKYHPAVSFLGMVEKWGYKNADLVISTLPNAKEHVEAVKGSPVNFRYIPMGIEQSFFEDPAPVDPAAFNKKEGDFWVGYAGTLGTANALDTIFEVAKELESTHPQIKFAFIGDGPLKEHFVKEYGELSNIKFIPPVAKKDLQPYLARMDMLVNTWLNKSIYRFGISPNKWMDYMLSARPILVAFSGYPCIIDAAGCGKFVEAENKEALKSGILEFYSRDKTELDEMGRRGREYLLNNLEYSKLSEEFYNALKSIKKESKSLVHE